MLRVVTAEEEAAYDANYATARRILTLFRSRLENYHASLGQAMDLRRTLTRSLQNAERSSATEDWCIDVAWCLAAVGFVQSYALTARTTRRQKSAENSWEQIATELRRRGHGETRESIRQGFRFALPIFVLHLESKNITPNLDGSPVTGFAPRCAASEHGEPCRLAVGESHA